MIIIICYHGVIETHSDRFLERNFTLLKDFESDIKLASQFPVLSLSHLNEYLTHQQEAPPIQIIITFDDGHMNNLLAHDILVEAGLPWALFISTGAVGDMIWTTELALLLLHGPACMVECFGKKWPIQDVHSRQYTYNLIRSLLKTLPAAERQTWLQQIRSFFPPALSILEYFPSMRMLNWSQLQALRDAGVEVGSHGVNHEIHHAQQPVDVRLHELSVSKRAIETRLNCSCDYFALPNGNWNPCTSTEISTAGYHLGFTVESGAVMVDCNRFLLPRMSPDAFRQFIFDYS